jgi:hypothetical protein
MLDFLGLAPHGAGTAKQMLQKPAQELPDVLGTNQCSRKAGPGQGDS